MSSKGPPFFPERKPVPAHLWPGPPGFPELWLTFLLCEAFVEELAVRSLGSS